MNTVQEYRMPILIGVITVVVAIVLWVGLISPQSSKLNTVNTNKANLESTLSGLQSQLTTLQTEKQKLPADCSQLEKISTQIPSVQSSSDLSAEESSFYGQLTTLVTSSGVAIPTFGFSGTGSAVSSGATGVVAVPVTMDVSGNYGQVTAFVQGLDDFPRLFVIQTFTLSLGGSSSAAAGAPAAPTQDYLWIGGTPTPSDVGPYSVSIEGSIYYTTQSNSIEACNAASGS